MLILLSDLGSLNYDMVSLTLCILKGRLEFDGMGVFYEQGCVESKDWQENDTIYASYITSYLECDDTSNLQCNILCDAIFILYFIGH